MANVTSHAATTLTFVTGVKDGEPVVESLRPGETRDIALRENDPIVEGYRLSGAITVEGHKPKKSREPAQP